MYSPPIYPATDLKSQAMSPLIQCIDQQIHTYEKWQKIAVNIKIVALTVIGTALICTGLFYTAPALPVIVVVALAVISVLTLQNHHYNHSSGACYALGLLVPLAFGLSGKIGKLIYNQRVASIICVANATLILPATLIGGLSSLAEEFFANRLITLKNLRLHALKLENDYSYYPEESIRKSLVGLFKTAYIKPLVHGRITVLPISFEAQVTRLGELN